MAARRVTNSDNKRTRRPPATTPEGRENQLIALAVDVAEKQLQEGTASSQVITHFLKLGSSDAVIDRKKKEAEIELIEKKKEVMASVERAEELMTEAISAFRAYSGAGPQEDEYDELED